MKYTVRPRHDGNGSFSILAADAQEALDYAKGLTGRGVENVEILDEDGTPCDLVELARTAESERR